MTDELLQKLKQLQCARSDISPFIDHLEFQQWADDVTPLLYPDTKLQNQFKQCVRAANISQSLNSTDGVNSNIGRAIGIVNQTITSLEVNPVPHSASSPTSNPPNAIKPPTHSVTIQIGVGVFIIFIGLFVGYLLKTHFGISQ